MSRPTSIILLAAGKGTRMRSNMPKVLHPIAGLPLLHHALQSTHEVKPERVVVITSPGADAVAEAALKARPDAKLAVQEQQNGTGDAVKAARDALEGFEGDAVVLFADTPLLKPETFSRVTAARNDVDVVVLGFDTPNPGRYGRLILSDDGGLDKIVEAADATPDELAVTLCNSGIIAADAKTLFELLDKTEPKNAQGEYYLTDVVGLARDARLSAGVVLCDEEETLGVNTRADLAAAEGVFQSRKRAEAMAGGVTLSDPDSVYFSADTEIAQDVTIGPNTLFGPGVKIESGAKVLGFAHIEKTHIKANASVGPFVRFRGGTEIGDSSKIGNFVEIKGAQLAKGVKSAHLTYLGDAKIGEDANIGAGTITCNYDGVMKHQTEIGARAFIGSNSALVAPVKIGEGAVTGSGSVITQDVPEGAIGIERSPQKNILGGALRLMERLLEMKAKRDKT